MRLTARLAVATAIIVGACHGAAADGAFPDAMGLLLPADQPHRIVLATNFGLVISDDDGASWNLVCEASIASYVSMYQLGPSPRDAFFADTPIGLATSSDLCAWAFATGPWNPIVEDAFPDPSSASRVFVVARIVNSGVQYALLQSLDGGRSLDATALFFAPVGMNIASVESSRSSPSTIYATMYSADGPQTFLLRSSQGAPFTTIETTAAVGGIPRIAAVDPIDPQTVWLRVDAPGADALAVTHNGGNTSSTVLTLTSKMSAFLIRANGAILVGGADGSAFQSTEGDAGQTFAPWPVGLHLRALAEREGVLYAAADNTVDPFALGVSTDDGAHWTGLLHFGDIRGPSSCVAATCAEPYAALEALYHFDAGVPDAGRLTAPAGGCGCTSGHSAPGALAILLALSCVTWLGWRRGRRNGRRADGAGARPR